MPTEDRSGTWYANRARARAIYSQHLIEQQALNQGTANRMNSNGASPGISTVLYALGTTSGSGEELASVLQANSAVPPLPPAPPTVPTAPTNLIVTFNPPAAGGILVSWTASSSPVTLYTVVSTPGGITKTSSSNTFVRFNEALDGIVLGTTYTFVVTAENDIGTSPPSATSPPIKAATYPDPPSGVSAIDGQNGQTTVSWIASIYDGESPITAYIVSSSSAQDPVIHSINVRGTDTSGLITGLTNGFQYIFYVTSTNAFGEGSQSVSSPAITPLGTPTQPLNVSAFAGTGNANVSWEAPLNDGGVPIISYTITSSPPDFADVLTMPFSPLSVIANGLTNGTSYTFTVFATNSKGDSPLSNPSPAVMPVGAPDPPTNVVATPGNASADVTWDEPQSYGGSGITSYRAVSIPGDISITTSPTQRFATFSGLVNGTSYEFVVFATNAIGESMPSGGSYPVTPSTVPTAPLNPFAVAGNAQADVFWTAPLSDGGSPIIYYTVVCIPATTGAQPTSDDSTTLVFTGLTNGTDYTFTVYATNVSGNSPASALTNPVTPTGVTAPGPPQTVSAALFSPGLITVSWSAPVSDGGSSILSYKIYPDPPDVAPQSVASAFVNVDFDNTLTNGTSYTFTVTATNAIGESLASTPSPSVIPIARPSVVQSVLATPRNQGAIVTWAQPSSDGGSPLINYTVNYKESTGSLYTTITLAPSDSSYEVTGLVNSTLYDFYVAADNALYTGDVGSPVQTTPVPTVADPPSILSVVSNASGTVEIEFAPSIYDGGGTVVNYLVEDVGATFSTTVNFSPAALFPLVSGNTYEFTVKTVTGIGTSLASAPSSSVTVQ